MDDDHSVHVNHRNRTEKSFTPHESSISDVVLNDWISADSSVVCACGVDCGTSIPYVTVYGRYDDHSAINKPIDLTTILQLGS